MHQIYSNIELAWLPELYWIGDWTIKPVNKTILGQYERNIEFAK